VNYLYDGSFEGFLTCVFEHYYTEKADGVFREDVYQLDLTRKAISLRTDEEKANRVFNAVRQKISEWDAERVYRAHCTEEPEKEMSSLRYIELGFRMGGRIRLLHGHPVVMAVEKAERRLGNEVHRLLGLVRFSEKLISVASDAGDIKNESMRPASGAIGRILYSPIEPDNDCLEFLAPHFIDRLREEPFIIHDLKRGKALAAYNKRWDIVELAADAALIESTEEVMYATLWRKYFGTMAIRERTNPVCQRNLMPARYWKHLTEMT
jgi:probable DNA metabolism protein